MSYNRVILMGKLVRDPELRATAGGKFIAKIGLALNRKWRDASGESKEEVTFVDVDVFGKQAETIGQYFKKGSDILVEGRLKLDTWEDKQTQQKRSRLGVVAESFSFVGNGGGKREEGEPPPRWTPPAQNTQSQPEGDSSIPF